MWGEDYGTKFDRLRRRGEEQRRREAHKDLMRELDAEHGSKSAAFVPSNVKIKRSKVGNIDSDRLWRRRGYLTWWITTQCDRFESRQDFALKAAEFCVIEDELVRRGMSKRERRTNDGQ